MQERTDPSEIWDKLSLNGKIAAYFLSQIVGSSIGMNNLIDAAGENMEPSTVESAISELTQVGFARKTSLLEEKEDKLKELGRSREIGVPSGKFKGVGNEYENLFREIQINKENPEWINPRWKLNEEYRQLVTSWDWAL